MPIRSFSSSASELSGILADGSGANMYREPASFARDNCCVDAKEGRRAKGGDASVITGVLGGTLACLSAGPSHVVRDCPLGQNGFS